MQVSGLVYAYMAMTGCDTRLREVCMLGLIACITYLINMYAGFGAHICMHGYDWM